MFLMENKRFRFVVDLHIILLFRFGGLPLLCDRISQKAILQHAATHCNTLQRIATHCNTLQHTATHCTTLQHTTTYSNALHHIPTHCNTLCLVLCACISCDLISCDAGAIQMSHVTYKWVMSRTDESCHTCHTQMSHVSCVCISWHEWVTSPTRMSQWVMSRDSFVWGSFICYMTRSYVTWLICVWHVWHDSFVCDMTHLCVTWLICMSNDTCMWHDSFVCQMLYLFAYCCLKFVEQFLFCAVHVHVCVCMYVCVCV